MRRAVDMPEADDGGLFGAGWQESLEAVQVVRIEFGQLDITDFRVQQNWFFAPSRKTLQCSAQAVAPAIPIIDEYGTRLALRPLFFWRKE